MYVPTAFPQEYTWRIKQSLPTMLRNQQRYCKELMHTVLQSHLLFHRIFHEYQQDRGKYFLFEPQNHHILGILHGD